MSDYAISFHYIKPKLMPLYDYFIYHLRPFGIKFEHQNVNADNKNRLLIEGFNDQFKNFTCFSEGNCKEAGWNIEEEV